MVSACRVGISICESAARKDKKATAILRFPQKAAMMKKQLLAKCVVTIVATKPILPARSGAKNMLTAFSIANMKNT